ncbi:hypothetical protein H5410_047864, partial [Solanum commersonii]
MSTMKMRSWCITEQLCEEVLLLPNASKCKNAEGKSIKAMKLTKRQMIECIERGHKTKTTKLIASGIGSTWVQLERVNPSPFLTHSARERECTKAEAVLNAATQCSREIELIR